MKVLLCSYFKFPEGDAGAIRHEKTAYMLRELGHEVFVVGLGKFCEFKKCEFCKIPYTSLREKRNSLWGKIQSRCKYWSRLKKVIKEHNPDVILMDDLRPIVTFLIKRYCKKNKIKLVHDSVEWYSPEQFKLGIFSISCINKNIINRIMIDKSIQVISISSYLNNYYSNKGIKSVRIPIVLAEKDYCRIKKLGNTMQFMYAGQPGKKDNLQMIIEAFYQLKACEKVDFKLHIVGCTREQIVSSGIPNKYINAINEHIEIHGRLKHEEVLELMQCIDFTLLMRNHQLRYAKAGFPTKVAESLSHSTPVIANITSDLEQYLYDGYNALIVEEYSSESLANTLKRAIGLSSKAKEDMCKNSLKIAEEKLHYRFFLRQLGEMLT